MRRQRSRFTLFGPLLVLGALGLASAGVVFLYPEVLLPTAIVLAGICACLILSAVLLRRIRPRDEAPSRAWFATRIRRATEHPSPRRVRRLLNTLGRWPYALDALGPAALSSVEELVRSTGATGPLLRALHSKRATKRRIRSIHIVSWLGIAAATDRLIALVRCGDMPTAYAAAAALARLGSHRDYAALLLLCGEGPLPASRVAALLADAPAERLGPVLQQFARDPNPDRRFWVAYLLGVTRPFGTVDTLLRMATDADADVRASASEALGEVGDPRAIPVLRDRLADEAWFVQVHAARSLGRLQAADCVEPLTSLLASPNSWVRDSAAHALEAIGAPAIPSLRRMLRTSPDEARRWSAEILLRLGFLEQCLMEVEGDLAKDAEADLRAFFAAGARDVVPATLLERLERRLPGVSVHAGPSRPKVEAAA